MAGLLNVFMHQGDASVRRRLILIYTGLIGSNVLVWIWALVALRDHPLLLGTALLAYTLGLRHAVDADHIAAIDNVTRKLMQQGQQPWGVGLYFSLGHSTLVVLMSVGVALAASLITTQVSAYQDIGGIISTCISALFLFSLAAFNVMIFLSVFKTFQKVKKGGMFIEGDLDILHNNRGLLARIFRPIFGLVTKSWHMFPVGFLFGLGFDTATEVALFGMSAAHAADGLSIWAILVFPALFTAGMSLVDTTDGVLMIGAYGWAFNKPMRKLYYNMTITAVSVIVAILIGGIETLGLISEKLGLEGAGWEFIGSLNDNFGTLGYIIIGVFMLSWIASVVIYRVRGYDRLEVVAELG